MTNACCVFVYVTTSIYTDYNEQLVISLSSLMLKKEF